MVIKYHVESFVAPIESTLLLLLYNIRTLKYGPGHGNHTHHLPYYTINLKNSKIHQEQIEILSASNNPHRNSHREEVFFAMTAFAFQT